MARFQTVSEFKARSILPQASVDLLEAQEPGFLQGALDDWQEEIEARLRKRYSTPFATPVPRTVLRWQTKLVTRDAYHKLGYNPSSQQDRDAVDGAAERCEAELKEAADAKPDAKPEEKPETEEPKAETEEPKVEVEPKAETEAEAK